MRALVMKEFRELARDRRTVAMLIVLPVLLLIIFGYAANFSVDRVKVAVVGPDAQSIADDLVAFQAGADGLDIVTVDTSSDAGVGQDAAEQVLREQKAAAVVIAHGDASDTDALSERMTVYLDGSQLFATQSATKVFLKIFAEDAQARAEQVRAQVEQAREKAQRSSAQLEQFGKDLKKYQADLDRAMRTGGPLPTPPTMPSVPSMPDLPDVSVPPLDASSAVTVLFNPDLKTSWVMVPGLIGLILTFIGTVVTAIGLVREREAGTLEQLAVMPLRPSAIIIGKIAPYFLLAIVDLVLITALGMWIFGVPFVGNGWVFALTAGIFLFVVLGIGVLVSSVSQTTGQAVQLAIMVLLPQILLSGLIFPLASMAAGVRWIGYLLPLTWFNIVSQGVMLRGATLESLWLPIVILAGQAVVIFGAATLRMRHLLTHGGGRQ
jgi:ABC-2 type transport system permease protein